MAYDLAEDNTGVILLSHAEHVREGDGVRGDRRLPELPVGPATLGRVLDPLGNPLDEGPGLPAHPWLPLFRPAPEIIDRKSVDETLWTGVRAIDAAIPIGRGQQELIVGDRNVGKTALAIDILSAQKHGDMACRAHDESGPPVITQVLPIRPSRPNKPLRRTLYQPHRHLAAVAVREFLYTTLHELLLDSLASEHGMRLLAAESARQWLDETAETARRQFSACRREATTQEVLDIVAGSRTRKHEPKKRAFDN